MMLHGVFHEYASGEKRRSARRGQYAEQQGNAAVHVKQGTCSHGGGLHRRSPAGDICGAGPENRRPAPRLSGKEGGA